MSWFVPAFDLWWQVTLAGLVLTAAAALAVLLTGQPARKIRIIQLALVGLLVLPALVLLPGYPRAASWPTVGDTEPVAHQSMSLPAKPGLQTKSPPAKPGAIAPQHADTASTSAAPKPPALPGGTLPAPLPDSTIPAAETPRARAPRTPTALNDAPQPPKTRATTPIPSARTARDFTTNSARAAPSAVAAPREPAGFTLPALPDYRLLVISAYFAGVALFALWWLIGRIALWRLLRTAMPAQPDVRALFQEVAASSDRGPSAARVRLLVSSRAAQPCAFGWLRPTIVLPERVVSELTHQQLRLALSHEWSHVARGDIRTWMLAGLVRLVHFYQPLLWLLRRELRVSQDYLADAAAAGVGSPEDYAELLTTLSQMLRPTPLSPGLGIAPRRSDLYRRVVMLVDPSRPLERTIPRHWNLAAVMLGVVLVAGVATLRAEPEEPEIKSTAPGAGAAADTASTAESNAQSAEQPARGSPTSTDPLAADARRTALEEQVVDLRSQLERLLKTRDQLARETDQQLHNKERDKTKAHLETINKECFKVAQQLNLRIEQLAKLSPPSMAGGARSLPELIGMEPGKLADAILERDSIIANYRRQVERQTTELIALREANAPQRELEKANRQILLLEERMEARRHELLPAILKAIKFDIGWPVAAEAPPTDQRHDQNGAPTANKSDALRLQFEKEFGELRDEISQLRLTRESLSQQAEKQIVRKERAKFETQIAQIDQQLNQLEKRLAERWEQLASDLAAESPPTDPYIAQRIDELLQPDSLAQPSGRFASQTTSEPGPTATGVMPSELIGEFNELQKLRKEILRHAAKEPSPEEKQKVEARLRELDANMRRLGLQIQEILDQRRQASLNSLLEGDLKQAVAALPSKPFSGHIRPGDILNIEIVGGLPDTKSPTTRTVEPDGNVVLGAVYGSASRVNVGGKTLIEAGQAITEALRDVLRNPQVVVTYEGHDEGVINEASFAGRPELLAHMMLEKDPQIVEWKRQLARKELELARARSSDAPEDALKTIQQEVLQLEQLIEEVKAQRMPALLELIAGSGEKQGRGSRASRSQPFSGHIRPGDILNIEIVGGLPDTKSPTTRTVEPDGNVVLGAVYGSASRVNVGGKTLIEAGQAITEALRDVLRNPQVVVTYEGHNEGIVAEGAPSEAALAPGAPAAVLPSLAAEPVILQPLDTIEIIAPIKPRIRIANEEGQLVEVNGEISNLSGTYVIEPDGRVVLPRSGGRVSLGGLTEAEAGEALRKHLSQSFSTRTALPTTRVLRRGRALFAEGMQPAADYKINPGDKLLLGDMPGNLFTYTVDSDGNLGSKQKVHVANLTLEKAQEAIRENWTTASEFAPWILTLGGWHEEADPQVIDRIEGTDATQLLRMQEEMEELKSMIQRLQAK